MRRRLSYGDYVEQLTFLLFLKVADEQSCPPFKKPFIPKGLDWQSLLERDGDELETHYRHILTELGKTKDTLGVIFRKAWPPPASHWRPRPAPLLDCSRPP